MDLREEGDFMELDKQDMQEPKQQSRMDKTMQMIINGVQEVFDSEKFKLYLSFCNKLPHYSVNNQILAYTQCAQMGIDDPGIIQGYHAWEKMGRHVLKGQKAITIIAPCTYKKVVDETDRDGQVKVDADGQKMKKEVEMKGFKAVSVFSEHQTEGNPLPEYISDLTDPVANYFSYLTAIEQTSPVPIRFDDLKGGVHGYYSPVGQEIVINRGMSEMQTLKTVCHEIAHARCNHGGVGDTTDKMTKECISEGIAFSVCDALGLSTGDYSFSYIAGYSSGRDVKELKASLDVIRQESSKMIEEITQRLEISMHRDVEAEGPKVDGHRIKMAM